MKEVLIKILKDYLRKNSKVEINYEEIAQEIIIGDLNSDYQTNYKRVKTINKLYKTVDKGASVKYNDYISVVISKEFGIGKNVFADKFLVDNKVTKLMLEYLNLKNKKKISFSVLQKNENNILATLEVQNIEYELLIEAQTKTLEELGKERNLSKERIRQIIFKLKKILKNKHFYLGYDYLISTDLRFIPKYEQAIIYANKEGIYNEMFDLYFFTEDNRKSLNIIEQALKELVDNNSKIINLLYLNYNDILNFFLDNNKTFYSCNNQVFTSKRQGRMEISNYIVNYLEEYEITRIHIDDKFLKEFSQTKHGRLYIKQGNGEFNERNILMNLERESEIYKIGTNNYMYDHKTVDSLKLMSNKLRKIIKQNVPINGTNKLTELFETIFSDLNLKKNSIFFVLKKMFGDEFNFKKNKITDLNDEIKDETKEMLKNLELQGYSFINNVTNSKNMSLKASEIYGYKNVIYLQQYIVVVDNKYFEYYNEIEKLKKYFVNKDLILRTEFQKIIPEKLTDKFGDDLIFKIFSQINDYDYQLYFATTQKDINNMGDVFNFFFAEYDDIIPKDKVQNFVSMLSNNYYNMLNKLIDKGYLKKNENNEFVKCKFKN